VKSHAQLEREIAAALARRKHHGTHVALKPWAGSEVQSLLFDKQWTVAEAKDWAASHGYRHGKVHVTDNYIRLRQFEPGSGEKRTITFGQGIKAIIEEAR
jgi:hypothetical protein